MHGHLFHDTDRNTVRPHQLAGRTNLESTHVRVPNTTDHISASEAHSISWLAQFVVQIVTALKWENEFRCAGVESLADFKGMIEELNSVDPGVPAYRSAILAPEVNIREFGRKMDALIGLLDSTYDSLTAEWDLRVYGADIDDGDPGDGGNWGAGDDSVIGTAAWYSAV